MPYGKGYKGYKKSMPTIKAQNPEKKKGKKTGMRMKGYMK
jgi:hypothetical protein